MHRLLYRQSNSVRRVANYGLLRRSIASISETTPRSLTPLQRSLTTSSMIKLTPPLINKRLAMMNRRNLATTKDLPAYKETPFLKWKLFPDFEHLVTQTSPAIAVPAFEKLIEAAKEQFLQIEKTFKPTWNGTIGQCKLSFVQSLFSIQGLTY